MRGALVRALFERHSLPSPLRSAILSALDVASGHVGSSPHGASAGGSDAAMAAAQALARSVLPVLTPSLRVELVLDSLRLEDAASAKSAEGAAAASDWRERLLAEMLSSPMLSAAARDRSLEGIVAGVEGEGRAGLLKGLLQRYAMPNATL